MPQMKESAFSVIHYAGKVKYHVQVYTSQTIKHSFRIKGFGIKSQIDHNISNVLRSYCRDFRWLSCMMTSSKQDIVNTDEASC